MMRQRQQKGMTLLMALVMLVALTLLALTSFNIGRNNMQVVGNMQQHDEALAAAREAIEEAISTPRLVESPDSVFASPCNGKANTRCIDNNADGKPDVVVTLAPKPNCVKAQVIKIATLDLSKKEDQECTKMQAQEFGTEGANTGNSMCADSTWEINAVAVDQVSEARLAIVQGVSVRVENNDIAANCPP